MWKSRSAFLTHSTTNARIASSDGGIQYLTVFMGWLGDPADDVHRRLESLCRHDQYVDRIIDISNGVPNSKRFCVTIDGCWFDNQKVLRHLARGGRTEENDLVGLRNGEDATRDFGQRV